MLIVTPSDKMSDSGGTNLTTKGMMVSWKGMTELNYWPEGTQ